MKRWEVKFDGLPGGHVYADTREAARRAARAAYKRIFPDRDGMVNVGEGVDVPSEAGEARHVVSQVYEGLRLLPGMEVPAEKLRNVLLLLESAVARESLAPVSSGASPTGGGGGDTELGEALEPILESKSVPSPIKARLRGLLEWVGLNTPEPERRKIELKVFQTLWETNLVDFEYNETPLCELHKASAYLTRRLTRAGLLRIERFEGATNVEEFREALQPYGDKDVAVLSWAFVREQSGPEPVEVRRPLVLLGDRVVQHALLRRGVKNENEEVVALDSALFDVHQRLQTWTEGLGFMAEPYFKDKQRQFVQRAEKRLTTVRQQMAKAAKDGGDVLPPDTARRAAARLRQGRRRRAAAVLGGVGRRDLVKFLIDQVHRIQDALALLPPDRSLRDAFAELVFKDIVFRSAGPYLSQRFSIDVDTEVVESADTEGLVGRFRKEPGGPKPKNPSSRIHSVVVPCYTQDGVTIRPASVRCGIF